MEIVTIRRTFSLGDFETLTIEATAEDSDLRKARLLASQKVLQMASDEMVRIFHYRMSSIDGNPYDKVQNELSGINQELGQ